jgi:hypothetical protein
MPGAYHALWVATIDARDCVGLIPLVPQTIPFYSLIYNFHRRPDGYYLSDRERCRPQAK